MGHADMVDAPQAKAARIVIGIPTLGRAAILNATVRAIADQSMAPDLVLISCADPSDTAGLDLSHLPFPAEVLTGPKGATFQRNRILDRLGPDDLLLLLDDDFLMAPDYVAVLSAGFTDSPDIVLFTGTVLADGILGPGLDHATGARLLQADLSAPAGRALHDVPNGYGCNMAFRMAPVVAHGLRFDERLPLYSWLEDVDFSARLAPFGRIVRSEALRGVHLGTKNGRTPGLLFGYSQVANPVYLIRKGTMGRGRALRLMLRNLASNLVRSVLPQPWADHRGRLRGNALALADLMRGCAAPERILDLAHS